MSKSSPIATLRQTDIIMHLREHPELLDDKKMHELVVGWLLSQFYSEAERDELYVGFPLKPDWEYHCKAEPATLGVLLEHSDKIVEDRDVDILIGKEETWLRCQITRFLNHPRSKKKRKLADVIAQKCERAQPDNKLILIVSVESQPKITIEELRGLPNIPFRQIILISKPSEARGHFSVCELYPTLTVGKEIRVPLPV